MNKKNLLILVEIPLNKRDYDRFGIEILKKYFNVKVFDFTGLINPAFLKEYVKVNFDFDGYYAIDSLATFLKNLDRQSIAIDYLGDSCNAIYIRKQLNNHHIRRTLVRCGLIPQPVGIRKIRRLFLQDELIRRIMRKILNPMKKLLREEVGKPDIVILSGKSGLADKKIQGALNYVLTHSFDYDEYLKNTTAINCNKEKYALYIDSDLVFHQEYMLNSEEKTVVTEDIYFPSINNFFDKFEKITGMRVIIAAHPRSYYELRPNAYGNRDLIIGKTAQLIRDSSLVMTMQSTAISYAVLWEKPLIFLNSDEYDQTDHREFMFTFAEKTKSYILNINTFEDAEIKNISNIKVNKPAYSSYKDLYIKYPGTPDLSIWEIFSDYIYKNGSNNMSNKDL